MSTHTYIYTHTISLSTCWSLTAAISWSEPNWRKAKQISEIVQFSAATTVQPTLSTGPCLISMNTVFPSELVTCQAVWTDGQIDARIYKVVCTCTRERQRCSMWWCYNVLFRWFSPRQQRHLTVFKLFVTPVELSQATYFPIFSLFLPVITPSKSRSPLT